MSVPQKICCQVEQIIDHGGQTYSVTLLAERPVPRFSAGQFLHLAIDPYEPGEFWPDSRVFSIASSPENRHNLHITYSVRGKFTARMERELKEGGRVWIKLPYGDFIIQTFSDVVLFAGGTGITAFTAFISGLTPSCSHHVNLFYGARTRELLIYRPMIDRMAEKFPALSCWYFVEKGEARSKNETIGMLSVEDALDRSTCSSNTNFYISGPPLMLKSFTEKLTQNGIMPQQIHIDAWE